MSSMTEEKLISLIKEKDEWAIGGLITIYRNQTQDEQSNNSVKYQNSVGFNGYDADILSSISQFYLKNKFLTPKQIDVVKKSITKYSKQMLMYSVTPLPLAKLKTTNNNIQSSSIKASKSATLSNNKIQVKFSIPKSNPNSSDEFAVVLNKIKSVTGRKFNPINKSWILPITEESIEVLKDLEFNIDKNILHAEEVANIKERLPKIVKDLEPGFKKINKILQAYDKQIFPYQKDGVAFVEATKGRALIADEAGCISKDAKIIVNRGGNARTYTMEELYNGFNFSWRKDIPSFTRSINKDRTEFRLNTIKKVIHKGKKAVYEITTKTHKLKTTLDHIFITPNGDTELKDLSIGDLIYTNGIPKCIDCGGTDDVSTYKYAKFKGYCKKCIYLRLRNNNVQKNSNGESIDKDGYIRLRRYMRRHPNFTPAGVYKHRLVYEAYLNSVHYDKWIRLIRWGKVNKEDHVILSPEQAIHHIDGNKLNNSLNNLKLLSHSKHQKLHGTNKNYTNFKGAFLPKKEKIISITKIGIEDVYDIQMKSPNHNFITNGIVVHNCGKTYQSLIWCAIHKEIRPIIVICPASVKLNWKKEALVIMPKAKIRIIEKEKPSDEDIYDLKHNQYDIFIINYDILGIQIKTKITIDGKEKTIKKLKKESWAFILKKLNPQIIIGDEVQRLKDYRTLRCRSFKEIVKKEKQIIKTNNSTILPHFIALSATPIRNKPIEFFTVLSILRPDIFYSIKKYANDYCNPKHNGFGWDYGGSSNQEKLNKLLVNSLMIRRKKSEVFKQMPERITTVIPIDITNREEYNMAELDLIEWIRSTEGNEKAKKAERAKGLIKWEKLKQLVLKGKMDFVYDWINDVIENDKLVIFNIHQRTNDLLIDKFKDISVKYDGRDSPKKKEEAKEKFITNEKIKLLSGNIEALGEGVDGLQHACSICAINEFPWTPIVLDQAPGRLDRLGQTKCVNVYHLIAINTIEEDIAALLDSKKQTLSKILDGVSVKEEHLITELINKLKRRRKIKEKKEIMF